MRVAIGLWLLAALLAGRVLADDMDERIPVEPGGRLEVDLDLGQGLRPDPGSLEVVSHDADQVWILADASGWGASGVRFRMDRGEQAVRRKQIRNTQPAGRAVLRKEQKSEQTNILALCGLKLQRVFCLLNSLSF